MSRRSLHSGAGKRQAHGIMAASSSRSTTGRRSRKLFAGFQLQAVSTTYPSTGARRRPSSLFRIRFGGVAGAVVANDLGVSGRRHRDRDVGVACAAFRAAAPGDEPGNGVALTVFGAQAVQVDRGMVVATLADAVDLDALTPPNEIPDRPNMVGPAGRPGGPAALRRGGAWASGEDRPGARPLARGSDSGVKGPLERPSTAVPFRGHFDRCSNQVHRYSQGCMADNVKFSELAQVR
jgi:hypothetical protein